MYDSLKTGVLLEMSKKKKKKGRKKFVFLY